MLIGIAGLSVIERYLIVAALALLVFAAVALGGFTMLRPGRAADDVGDRGRAAGAGSASSSPPRASTSRKLTNELQFRGDAHTALVQVLREPAVTAALRCGPLTAPNHKLVPDARWILDLPRDRVLARADPDVPRRRIAARRRALRHDALRDLPPRLHEPGRPDVDPGPAARAGAASPPATTSPRMPAARGRRRGRSPSPRSSLGALALRLWGFRHGLPLVYNADENAHFVAGAIGMFGHTYNPNYFINPPAYTYLLHVAFALGFGGRDGVAEAFAADPGDVFAVARALSAVLGAVAVGLLAWAGARLFDRRVGLVAAALLAVAFLPVHYAHFALNDVPTLAPRLPRARRHRRRLHARAPRRLRARRRRARARLRDEVHRRDRAAAAAGGGPGRRGRVRRPAGRRARARRRAGARVLPHRQPVRAAGLRLVPRRPHASSRRRRATAAASSA